MCTAHNVQSSPITTVPNLGVRQPHHCLSISSTVGTHLHARGDCLHLLQTGLLQILLHGWFALLLIFVCFIIIIVIVVVVVVVVTLPSSQASERWRMVCFQWIPEDGDIVATTGVLTSTASLGVTSRLSIEGQQDNYLSPASAWLKLATMTSVGGAHESSV